MSGFILKHDGTCAGDLNIDGTLKLEETGAGTDKVTIQAPSDITQGGGYTLTLPPNDGDSGQFLQTDGSGSLAWAEASGGGSGGTDTSFSLSLSDEYNTYTSDATNNTTNTNSNGIVWSPELSLFVYVSQTGTDRVATSPDGVTWTARTAAIANNWTAVTWSPELTLFVAVAQSGTGNRVMTSPDGITWTSRTTPQDNAWGSITWSPELTLFVVVSTNGTNRIMTSPDGITWTTRNAPVANQWYDVVWSSELSLFVSVATSGTGNRVMTSTNGTTWVSRTSAEDSSWANIAWSPELTLFAAVSLSGTNQIMTSPDGITWTTRSEPEANTWRSLTWAPEIGLFICISSSGTNRMMTSSDGITWTTKNIGEDSSYSGTWSPDLNKYVVPVNSSKDFKTFGTILSTQSAVKMNKLLLNNGSNVLELKPPDSFTNYSLTLPINSGTFGQVLTTSGTGSLTWEDSSGGATSTDTKFELILDSDNVETYEADAASAVSYSTSKSMIWASELGLFVSVSISGTDRVVTSSDGTTWTGRTATEANQWRSVTYSPELNLLVAVSTNGTNRVMTSPDGITWTTRTAAEANSWYSVAWSSELSLFVAVAGSGTNRVMTSPDGITWTTRTAAASNTWYGITWSTELTLFVAIAQSGTGNRVMTSPDGITWTTRTSAEDNSWSQVIWSSELNLFVAVSPNGTNRVMTSPDGITWTGRTAAEVNSWYGITWSPELGLLMAVSSDGTNRMMTSPDGITWTSVNIGSRITYNISWSPELKLAAVQITSAKEFLVIPTFTETVTDLKVKNLRISDSDNTNFVKLSSPDLTSDLTLTLPNSKGNYDQVISSDGKGNMSWVNKSDFSKILNPDYFTIETDSPDNQTTGTYRLGVYSPELNLAVIVFNSGTNLVATSPDGVTWTGRTASQTNSWNSVAWSPELSLFVAVSSNGTNRVMTSPDGITWTVRTAAEANSWYSIVWSSELNLFAAVSGTGTNRVMTSPDGITWTTRGNSSTDVWRDIIWVSELNLFVAVASSGTTRVRTSHDGITWTDRTEAETNSWNSVTWSPDLGLLVAVSNNGTNRVMTSPDGITWTTRTAAEANNWYGVTWAPSLQIFIAISNSGTNRMMTSPDGITWTSVNIGSDTQYFPLWIENHEKLVIIRNSSKELKIMNTLNTSYENSFKYNSLSLSNNLQTNYVKLRSPDDLNVDYNFTLPSTSPVYKQILLTDNNGNLTWTDREEVKNTNFNVGLKNGFNTYTSDTTENCSYSTSSITSSGTTFVAVCSSAGERVFTSSDGITWIGRTAAEQISWNSVTWAEELNLFVAVASSGTNRVMTSPDGITWTTRTAAQQNLWYDVVWSPELSLFVSVSGNGTNRCMTSPDGITWTTRTISSLDLRNITWSPELGLFIVVAYNSSSFIYSYDGITWATTGSGLVAQWKSIVWSPELLLFVAVNRTSADRVRTSPDGFTWTGRTAAEQNSWEDVTWSKELGLFIAVASSGTNRMMTSPDGITWTAVNIGETEQYSVYWSGAIGKIAIPIYSSKKFTVIDSYLENAYTLKGKDIIVSNNTGNISLSAPTLASDYTLTFPSDSGSRNEVLSSDGSGVLSWVNNSDFNDVQNDELKFYLSNNTDKNIYSSFMNGVWSSELGLFVFIKNNSTGERVLTSSDGITWTTRTSAADNSWYDIAWSPELSIFVAVAGNGTNRVMTSPDGITWTARTSAEETSGWYCVTWSPELSIFVSLSVNGTNRVMTSPDGITWTTRAFTEVSAWYDVVWSPELSLFVAVAGSGTNHVATSPDGITWTTRTAAEANSWYSIAWSSELNLFVAVASSGTNRVMTSPDGITWTARAATEANTWRSVTWVPEQNLFYATSNSGTNRMMTSPDGITWTVKTVPQKEFYGIVWSPELKKLVFPIYNSREFAVFDTFKQNEEVYNQKELRLGNSDTNIISIKNTYAENDYTIDLPYTNTNSGGKIMTSGGENGRLYWKKEILNIEFPNAVEYSSDSPDNHSYSVNKPAIWANELGLFVAVSTGGTDRVVTSSDGITWTGRTAAENNSWRSLTYSPELNLLVAVSNNGTNRVMTSPDGITWTTRTAAEANSWYGVTWSSELSLFVAVANSGTNRVMTSPDGITWTARTIDSYSWVGVEWSPDLNLFAAVANSGTDRVAISPDGINWTPIFIENVNSWQTITWSSELGIFLSLASSGSERIMISKNGFTWTTFPFVETIYNAVWIKELGFWFGVNNTAEIMISSDGINWVDKENSTLAGAIYGVMWSPELNKIVCVRSASTTFYDMNILNNSEYPFSVSEKISLNDTTSNSLSLKTPTLTKDITLTLPDNTGGFNNSLTTDAKGILSWSKIQDFNKSISSNYHEAPSTGLLNHSYGQGRNTIWVEDLSLFIDVASGGDSDRVYTSPDGYSWTQQATPQANQWKSVTWSPELSLLVAVSLNGTNRVMTSPDGITWTNRIAAQANTWYDVTWSPELSLFVAVAASGTNRTMHSSDGISWTTGTIPNAAWYGITWSPELSLFVAVGNSFIATSTNGTSWTQRSDPESNNWYSIEWSPELNLFVGVASSGTGLAMSSSDGITWVTRDIEAQSWQNVTWTKELGLFIAISSGGNVAITSDGINWESLFDINISLQCGAYNDGKFVCSVSSANYYAVFTELFTKNIDLNVNNFSIKNFATDNKFAIKLSDDMVTDLSLTLPSVASGYKQYLTTDYDGILKWEYITQASPTDFNANILDTYNIYSLNTVDSSMTFFPSSIASNENITVIVSGNGTERVFTSTDGITWVTRTAAENNTWKSVTWSNDLELFAAVASNGTNRVMTSPDGITWTTRTAAEENIWEDVIWVSELTLFIACSSNGTNRFMTSPDGITWTARAASSALEFKSLVWSPEIKEVLCVSHSASFNYSTDGINWTTDSLGVTNDFESIAWSSKLGLYVAVASSGTASNRIRSSPDGDLWTSRGIAGTYDYREVIWSEELELFIAIASNGTTYRMFTSPDGITWTGVDISDKNTHYSIHWNKYIGKLIMPNYTDNTVKVIDSYLENAYNLKGKDIIVSNNTGNISLSAPTLVSDYTLTFPSDTGSRNEVLSTDGSGILSWVNNSDFDLILEDQPKIYYSDAPDFNGYSYLPIIWSSELSLFVAVASSGTDRIATSPDGINWTAITSPEQYSWNSITYSPELNLIVVVASSGTGDRVMTSSDGITWVTRTTPEDYSWSGVEWSPELSLFVAVASSGTGERVMTSPDGITWTTRSTPADNSWISIVWSPELTLFVVVATFGTGNRVMTSPDGITWTTRSTPADNNWYDVTWSPELNLFAACSITGTGNRVMTSPDGITWTTRSTPEDNNWRNILWIPEKSLFYAVANTGDNRLITSSDGITWINRSFNNDIQCLGLAWSPELNKLASCITTSNRFSVLESFRKNEVVYHQKELRLGDSNTNTVKILNNNVEKDYKFNLPYSVTNLGGKTLTYGGEEGSMYWNDKIGLDVSYKISNTYYSDAIDNSTYDRYRYGLWSPELSLFVAVSTSGTDRVVTSSDGVTWNARNAELSLWRAIVWSPELTLLVAVAYSGTNRVMTSPDGITWTSRTAAEANPWVDIAWSPELGLFAAVAYSGTNRLMTSPDGITWTTRTVPQYGWYGIAWSSPLGMFVAVGNNSTRSMHSYDGITWNISDVGDDTTAFYNITWSEELQIFLAMSTDADENIGITSDGINWSIHDSGFSSMQNPVWVKEAGLFFAIRSTGSERILTSPDGINWSGITTGTSTNYDIIIWSPELKMFALPVTSTTKIDTINPSLGSDFSFVSSNFSISNESDNKITLSTPSLNSDYTLTLPDNVKFNSALYSTDDQGTLGFRYFNTFAPFLSNYDPVEYIDQIDTSLSINVGNYVFSKELKLYVGVSASGTGNRAITSTDGINWTTQSTPQDNNWVHVTWSPELGLFAAIAQSGSSNRVMTSPDGITWTTRISAADNNWQKITWGGGLANTFVAVSSSGSNNRCMTSQDGLTWTTRTLPNLSFRDVIYSEDLNMFLAVHSTGFYRSTNNGVSWSSSAPAESNGWYSVDWSPKLQLFATVGNAGTVNRVATSTNGSSWTTRVAAESAGYTFVRWIAELEIFFAIATNFSKSMYSYDGITWTAYDISSITTMPPGYVWNPYEGYFLMINSSDNVIHVSTDLQTKGNVVSYGVRTSNMFISNTGGNSINLAVSDNVTENYTLTLPDKGERDQIFSMGDDEGNIVLKNVPYKSSFSSNYETYPEINSNNWTDAIWAKELGLYVAIHSSTGTECVATSPDGITWTTRTTPDLTYKSITWSSELTLLVAVASSGTGGRAITSPDGIVWTQRTTADDTDSWNTVVWGPAFNDGNGYFVAIASDTDANPMYSSDGITWTSGSNNSTDMNYNDMVYADGRIVGTSSGGTDRVLISTSGTFFSDASTSNDSLGWHSVAYSEKLGIHIIVNSNINSTTKINKSINGGGSWTNVTMDSRYTTRYFSYVQWIDYAEMFIIVINSSDYYLYSTDGDNWFENDIPFDSFTNKPTVNNDDMKTVIFGQENIYIYGHSLNSDNITSDEIFVENGVYSDEFFRKKKYKISNTLKMVYRRMVNDWYTTAVPEENTWQDVLWVESSKQFIACSSDGTNRIMKSTDAETWTTVTQNTIAGATQNQCIASNGDDVVIIGLRSGLDSISYSNDGGDTWNDSNHPDITSRLWNHVIWAPEINLYVAVGYGGVNTNRVMTTTSTGISGSWVTRTTPNVANNWVSVTWSPELFIFVACATSGGSDRIMTSTNGTTWITRTTPNANNYTDVTWSSDLGLFVACSNTGTLNRIITSPDGTNWTSRTTPIDNSWNRIRWIGEIGMFAVISIENSSDAIMTSEDGIKWRTRTVPTGTSTWRSVDWSPDLGCLVGVGSGSNMKAMHTLL